jgi:hypothetical protein
MKAILLLVAAAGLTLPGAALADPGHGRGHGHGNGVGNEQGGCPPGLAKKNNGCLPPGQARKLARGQRWQSQYGSRYAYGQIPYSVRNRYDLNPRYNYYYDNGYLYQVDPRTLLVQQVISALLR